MVPEQQEPQNILKNLPLANDHVFVKATFSIPPRSHVPTTPTVHNHKFDETNCQPMILGLPEGVIPSKVSLFLLKMSTTALRRILAEFVPRTIFLLPSYIFSYGPVIHLYNII